MSITGTPTTPPRPGFDPELSRALSDMPLAPGGSQDVDSRRREMNEKTPSIDTVIAGTGFEHHERIVPGPHGAPDIKLSVVRDPSAPPGPCIYFTHGGAMMFGSRATGAANFPAWVREFGATVVSVEYRLAPENPFPAGVEDSYAGLLWVAHHGEQIGADVTRTIIAGESAGGGITAAIALIARDRGGPTAVGQLLTAPMLDDRLNTVSAQQFTETPAIFSGKDDARSWTALLGDARGTADVSPYAAPARAADLSGLPSAFVEVGSAEVFRDEAVDYAVRIWAAGGQAELHVWAGAYHGFEMFPKAAITQQSQRARLNWMRRLLSSNPASAV